MENTSRRSFLLFGLAGAAGLAGWEWLATRPQVDGLPYPLRRALEFNERLAAGYFNAERLAPTFPPAVATEPRVNGGEGLSPAFDVAGWRLHAMGAGDARYLTLEEIKRLPRVEMTTELTCIEGWSVIVNWTGCRLKDLADTLYATWGGGERGTARAGDETSLGMSVLPHLMPGTTSGWTYRAHCTRRHCCATK
jgi:DMSO/TMAO reductase YedYZ molybdopterin-dependent catalytic subunit